MKPIKYKGFYIKPVPATQVEPELLKVYTAEEWAYGAGFRCCEWEACSLQEAKDFVDSYE